MRELFLLCRAIFRDMSSDFPGFGVFMHLGRFSRAHRFSGCVWKGFLVFEAIFLWGVFWVCILCVEVEVCVCVCVCDAS